MALHAIKKGNFDHVTTRDITWNPTPCELPTDMDVEEIVDIIARDLKPENTVGKDALAVEQLLIDWFEGRGPSGLSFYAEQADLDCMISYMKALTPAAVALVLPQLLVSPYLRRLVGKHQQTGEPFRLPSCVPTVHFRAIPAPYVVPYNRLVKQYRLAEFIIGNYNKKFKFDAYSHGVGRDIYMCFIQFGDLYIVNLLPSPVVSSQ
jgi:hypothetical protein